ncbi:MAG: hypothetical protein JSV86_08665 [Gemmatimonadota bacterium]|nr:MAG: hypothetical protein JSV86_08665 [Gemmatimonadota bacterium]
MNRSNAVIAGLLALGLTGSASAQTREACTSAVVGPAASVNGVPLLWKNRDTGTLSNKVVYVEDTPYSYLGLIDFDAPGGRHVFAGLNSAGFGIMNTVAYNLPRRSGEMEDLEGIIMADALRTCRSVDDFERQLEANLGPNLGSWANFGVIDADGKAVIFEVHNHGYEKHDAAAAERSYLVNTNFARSGAPGEGAGYLRFERASRLFDELAPGQVDFQTILTRFTRDLGHALLDQPSLEDARQTRADQDLWIFTRDCVNRPSTAAAVVIVGKDPADPASLATMWVIPGEPLTAIAIPLWVEAASSPTPLWEGDEAPMWRESLRVKEIIRPLSEGYKWHYLNLTRLDNAEGTGYLPVILETEAEIIAETLEFLKQEHTAAELAAFQERMVARALATLRAIQ